LIKQLIDKPRKQRRNSEATAGIHNFLGTRGIA
jgi:hypothetical protein